MTGHPFELRKLQSSYLRGDDFKSTNEEGYPPLTELILSHDCYNFKQGVTLDVANWLVEHGADVNQRCLRWDKGPLWYLMLGYEGTRTELADIGLFLLSQGADIHHDMQEEPGKTLQWVYRSLLAHQDNLVEAFIKCGVDLNQDPGYGGLQPLESVLRQIKDLSRTQFLTELFLSHGVDPNQYFLSGKTPIEVALLQLQNIPVCDALLRHGADLNICNKDGMSLASVIAVAEETTGALNASWVETKTQFEKLILDRNLPDNFLSRSLNRL